MSVKPTEQVRNLEPYTPGEQPRLGEYIKLNTNENPYPPAPSIIRALREFDPQRVRLYPDPQCSRLKEILSKKHGVSPEWIFVGNGSDEVLRLVFQAYLSPGDRIATTDPTYSLYPVLANFFGAILEPFKVGPEGELPDFIDLSPFRIAVIANPNPPLGTFFTSDAIEKLASAFPDVLFLIDEAYVDFAEGDSTGLIRSHENTVIARSFSKSYSLAGMRVGYALGSPEIIRNLSKIKDSYNVNALSQTAACEALLAEDYYQETTEGVKAERSFLSRELESMGFKVYDSQANFIFAEKEDGKTLYEKLKEKKFLVRHFNTPRLRKGVRISIGTHEQMEKLLEVIRSLDE